MSEVRCKSCRVSYEPLYGHPINRCEQSPVIWWVRATHAKYGGREVWLPIGPLDRWSLRQAIKDGDAMRLGRLRALEALGLETAYSRGPNGRGLCCWCGEEVAPRRQSWCSNACVEDYRLHHDWGYIRARVRKRDRGVCSACGCDTNLARDWWWRITRGKRRRDAVLVQAMTTCGWPWQTRDWWEADHIVARKDGGSDHPDNLRTLCVPCHKDRTRQQQARWAQERREAGATLFNHEEAPA